MEPALRHRVVLQALQPRETNRRKCLFQGHRNESI